jgi:lysine/arginine/ornithine transport system substrate-binding protein
MKLRALVVGMGLLCTFSSFAASELRYGLEAEYPPFESRNAAGELEGFDVELGNAICKAAALKCSWVETSFDALIPGLVAKKFDAINSAMNITEQRRKSIDFTQPIYRIPSQLVGKAGTAVEATPEGLKGKPSACCRAPFRKPMPKSTGKSRVSPWCLIKIRIWPGAIC